MKPRKKEELSPLQILEKRRGDLRRALDQDLGALHELRMENTGRDIGDAARDTAQSMINSQLADVETRELNRVEHAIELNRKGKYGFCEECGTKIPKVRLEAIPYATHCVKCASKLEGTGGRNVDGGENRRPIEGSSDHEDLSMDTIDQSMLV